MPDLQDGESVFVQGSASRPYQLKNVAGVYSCTCPAWRNQSLPIDRRTCKHLRSHRGDHAEEKRIGALLPAPQNSKPAKQPPPLLLAESWNDSHDPTGWWLSEKLDGVRAFWNGQRLVSRQGNTFHAPAWFTEGLPLEPLDGELWLGRKQFQRTVSIVRRQDGNDLWKDIRYRIFDAPAHDTVFEKRLDLVRLIIDMHRPRFALTHDHVQCRGAKHLHHELERVQGLGGEGLMLRQPRSLYTAGRSSSLLKVKDINLPFQGDRSMSSATSVSKKRRFEYVEGSSNKFWEVSVEGSQIYIQFGRNGTHGQSVVKAFADVQEAIKHGEKLIREKTGKGYVEVNKAA